MYYQRHHIIHQLFLIDRINDQDKDEKDPEGKGTELVDSECKKTKAKMIMIIFPKVIRKRSKIKSLVSYSLVRKGLMKIKYQIKGMS